MKTQEKLNMTMLCDFYELTMGNGYFKNGYKDRITYFDVFFRRRCRMAAALLSPRVWSSLSIILRTSTSARRISPIFGAGSSLTRSFDLFGEFRFHRDIIEGTPLREPAGLMPVSPCSQ